ncbi:hypothetical protein AB0B74_07860 [Micromonospora parva]|uniref:hypothetical protein n=1 Tax=Micromonospora parva TaxID=1464048 RepID=UPI00341157BF
MFLRVVSATAIGMLAFAATESAHSAPNHGPVRSLVGHPSTGTAVLDGAVDGPGAQLMADGGFEWRVSVRSDGGFEWSPMV